MLRLQHKRSFAAEIVLVRLEQQGPPERCVSTLHPALARWLLTDKPSQHTQAVLRAPRILIAIWPGDQESMSEALSANDTNVQDARYWRITVQIVRIRLPRTSGV